VIFYHPHTANATFARPFPQPLRRGENEAQTPGILEIPMKPIVIAALALTLVTGAVAAEPAQRAGKLTVAIPDATATLKGPSGAALGSAMFWEGPRGLVIRIQVDGLTPGWHGLHFHEKGDCGSADFKSAGGHVHDMAAAVHGLLNSQGNEAGDLPNLYVGPDGSGTVELFSAFVSLKGAPGRVALLDADGAALVIHAADDDYTSQPIGNAGARVACGVITTG
jgi:Cu-Zn family superoxide dismutase